MNEIDRVLASLEEYFALKRDLGPGSDQKKSDPLDTRSPSLTLTKCRERATLALDQYIGSQIREVLENSQDPQDVPTIQVKLPIQPTSIQLTWNDVVDLIDALNSPPVPPAAEHFKNPNLIQNWDKLYRDWYTGKRKAALGSIIPPQTLILELE